MVEKTCSQKDQGEQKGKCSVRSIVQTHADQAIGKPNQTTGKPDPRKVPHEDWM